MASIVIKVMTIESCNAFVALKNSEFVQMHGECPEWRNGNITMRVLEELEGSMVRVCFTTA